MSGISHSFVRHLRESEKKLNNIQIHENVPKKPSHPQTPKETKIPSDIRSNMRKQKMK